MGDYRGGPKVTTKVLSGGKQAGWRQSGSCEGGSRGQPGTLFHRIEASLGSNQAEREANPIQTSKELHKLTNLVLNTWN